MNRKILLVDDDQMTHVIVRGVLDTEVELKSFYTLADALHSLETEEPPLLAIIDRSLPDGDGLSICTKMRSDARLVDVAIIFLSSKDTETDKVGGLFAGADDYITKPVSPLELKARIQARLRSHSKKLLVGNLLIDLATHRAYLTGRGTPQPIDLTRIEFKLLITLVQAIDRVFSREQLLLSVWGSETNLNDRVVDTHLSHLRKKIVGAEVAIEALRGEGYRLSKVAGGKNQAA